MVDSEPPASIASASPRSMIRADSPIECRPVVQADTTAKFGPLKPYMIETLPEIMLMIAPGIRNGEMRRGPRLTASVWLSSIRGKPPMPDPTMHPIRSRLSSLTSIPLSATACTEAATP